MEKVFGAIKLDNVHASDQQVSLDVPRCHQYQPLLSSPAVLISSIFVLVLLSF